MPNIFYFCEITFNIKSSVMHTTYSEKVFSSLTSIFTELGFYFIRKYYKVFQISKLCLGTEKYVEPLLTRTNTIQYPLTVYNNVYFVTEHVLT